MQMTKFERRVMGVRGLGYDMTDGRSGGGVCCGGKRRGVR